MANKEVKGRLQDYFYSGKMVCVVSPLLVLKNNDFNLNLPVVVSTRI